MQTFGCTPVAKALIGPRTYEQKEAMSTESEAKLLLFGGCHVMSYPPLGFFDLTKAVYPATLSVAHTKASHTARILAKIEEIKPDVVVFQLGNYENPYPLFDRLLKKIQRMMGRYDAAKTGPMPYFLGLPVPLKIALDRLLSCFGLGIANPRSYRSAFEITLRETVSVLPGRVIVLSPFPSLVPWVQYGRARANAHMRTACTAHGVRFLDLFELTDHTAADFYDPADLFHFDAKGQRLLHELLMTEVRAVLKPNAVSQKPLD